MLKVIKVTGESLSPAFQEGDYVIVTTLPLFLGRLKSGDTIVFRHYEYGLLIKKVAEPQLVDGGISVIGTHVNSIDSRNFGPIPRDAIQGKVIWHIRRPRQ